MSLITQEIIKDCCYITLNRPTMGNALSSSSIDELMFVLSQIKKDPEIKCLAISANGNNFCTGIDLNWMHECSQLPWEENLATAQKISDCLNALSQLNIPKICIIKGHVIGAGIGLVACCNIVVAENNTTFSLPELKLDILPAIILPHLAKAIGAKKAQAYALLSKPWQAEQALIDGLIDNIATKETIKAESSAIIANITAISTTSLKRFINCINESGDSYEALFSQGASYLAKARSELPAQKKLKKFLKK